MLCAELPNWKLFTGINVGKNYLTTNWVLYLSLLKVVRCCQLFFVVRSASIHIHEHLVQVRIFKWQLHLQMPNRAYAVYQCFENSYNILLYPSITFYVNYNASIWNETLSHSLKHQFKINKSRIAGLIHSGMNH